jgi:hypothetical protein
MRARFSTEVLLNAFAVIDPISRLLRFKPNGIARGSHRRIALWRA